MKFISILIWVILIITMWMGTLVFVLNNGNITTLLIYIVSTWIFFKIAKVIVKTWKNQKNKRPRWIIVLKTIFFTLLMVVFNKIEPNTMEYLINPEIPFMSEKAFELSKDEYGELINSDAFRFNPFPSLVFLWIYYSFNTQVGFFAIGMLFSSYYGKEDFILFFILYPLAIFISFAFSRYKKRLLDAIRNFFILFHDGSRLKHLVRVLKVQKLVFQSPKHQIYHGNMNESGTGIG